MFRSAAAAFRERVYGVLLTGLLDDGVAGLWEIQQQGGTTIVQDPEEAAYRDKPENVRPERAVRPEPAVHCATR
jgi:two-component system chemotaxis response regulator CheB